jgi:hypothetical protein
MEFGAPEVSRVMRGANVRGFSTGGIGRDVRLEPEQAWWPVPDGGYLSYPSRNGTVSELEVRALVLQRRGGIAILFEPPRFKISQFITIIGLMVNWVDGDSINKGK